MRNGIGKRIAVAGISLSLSLLFVSCGAEKAADGKEYLVNVTALAERIVREGSFKDEMNPLEEELFEAEYEGIEETLMIKKSVYMGTGATAEQVVVAEAKDAASAKKLKEELASKLEDDIKENQDYNPEEVAKLKTPVLEVKEKYAIMVVSEDNAKVEEIVKQECE